MTSATKSNSLRRIGTLGERSLHRQLKEHYLQDHALSEQTVGKYVVDVLVDDHIFEIQTGNFGALKNKIPDLLKTHSVTLVYPIAETKILLKETLKGVQRRRSPKVGRIVDVFDELVYLPTVLNSTNFSLEIALVEMEELRHYDARKAWRRNHWVVSERRLVKIERKVRFESYENLYDEFAVALPEQFTTATIAHELAITRNRAQKFAYCFREGGILSIVGKEGNALIYTKSR